MRRAGDVTISNAGCFQDLIGVLINNGYSVTIVPICNGKKLAIEILEESEDEE